MSVCVRAAPRRWLLLVVACLQLNGLARAHAQVRSPDAGQAAASRMQVRLPDCGAAPWTRSESDELLRALQLELRSEGVREVSAAAEGNDAVPPQLELDTDCGATRGEFVLRVRVAPTAEPASKRLDLRDVPVPLRPRALSLALAELLRASLRAEPIATPSADPAQANADSPSAIAPATNPAPAAASAATVPAASNPDAPPQTDGSTVANAATASQPAAHPPHESSTLTGAARETRHQLWLAPNARWLLSSSDGMYGAAVGWQWRRLGASVHALFGQAGDVLGATHFGLVHAVSSYRALQLPFGRQLLHAGPALGAGVTWASASTSASANGGSALLPTYQLGLQLGISRELTSALGADLCIDAGYARGPALRADDRDLATLSGVFLGATLSATMELGSR